MNKVALPIRNNKLCAHFEQCTAFIIYTVEDQKTAKSAIVHTHLQPGLFPYWLSKKGVTDLITNSIDSNAISKLNQFKINVFVGVKSLDPKTLVNNLIEGTLETNSSLVESG